MVTPEGVLYEREAILTYMVDQKAKIAATKKRKLKEAEKEDEDETPKKKVFKGQCKFKAIESTCPNYILKRPRIPLCKDLDQKLTIFGNQDTNLKAIKPHSNQKTLIRKVLLILSEKCIQNVMEKVEKTVS